ncbi:MAG: HAMP domain-containing sensor histidine kinase [Verrucomicrobiota bacterium]
MADFIFADDYRLDESQTRRFYEEFLKGLVHKHNNLMGVIQGFSSLILYDESISKEVRDSAEQMQEAAKTASDLNRDILTAAGCSRCDNDTLSLDNVLPYWTSKAEEICEENEVSLHLNSREGIPQMKGDSRKLGEVFEKIIRNAAEAAADTENGSVAVDIFPPGEASPGTNVDLFVRNTSIELSNDDLRKVFEPFYTSRGTEFFGIGMTTAAVLAGQMGMRLGLRHAEGTTTAWLAIPSANG